MFVRLMLSRKPLTLRKIIFKGFILTGGVGGITI